VLEEFDGNLIRLTERLKRHPEEARQLHALKLVQTMVEKWNAQDDPVESSDEVPATAWVVRRKIEMVLPRPALAEPAEPESLASPAVTDSDHAWLEPAIACLRHLRANTSRHHERPRGEWPKARHPVRGRSIETLPRAWPRLKPRTTAAPTTVLRETDPLPKRVERWRQALAPGRPVFFPDEQTPRQEVVGMFIALLLLWSSGEVSVHQHAMFEPLEVGVDVNA
jgi:chromatin segregation and condensation protein Rec8/ScpA/Scc1 (kleisin family)